MIWDLCHKTVKCSLQISAFIFVETSLGHKDSCIVEHLLSMYKHGSVTFYSIKKNFFNKMNILLMLPKRWTRKENPASIYLLKVNNRDTKTRCEICSKLTIKTPERCNWRRSGVFTVDFEYISHLVLVDSIAKFEPVIADWEVYIMIMYKSHKVQGYKVLY